LYKLFAYAKKYANSNGSIVFILIQRHVTGKMKTKRVNQTNINHYSLFF
jgi:hypothetical protein